LDATRIKFIPAEPIEKYLEKNGMILELPAIEKSKDMLMAYGRTWRPFVVKYLESYGFDGILFNKNEIVIFKPERWVVFDSIDQGDTLYTALIESLNKNKTQEIAEKYNVDPQTLKILRLLKIINELIISTNKFTIVEYHRSSRKIRRKRNVPVIRQRRSYFVYRSVHCLNINFFWNNAIIFEQPKSRSRIRAPRTIENNIFFRFYL
jgi:hypothetical protein